jgi:integrase
METKEAAPLTVGLIRELMELCKKDEIPNRGLRDRALILIGFAAALRRSELIALDVEDIEFVVEGLELIVRKSKTDQQGIGHTRRVARGDVPITCPVTALRDWLNATKIAEGGIFRRVFKGGQIGGRIKSGEAVRGIVKRRLKEIGREDWDAFSGHSFRKGFASVAAERGSGIAAIQAQGNWKSTRAMLGYIKNREGWETAASKNLGL